MAMKTQPSALLLLAWAVAAAAAASATAAGMEASCASGLALAFDRAVEPVPGLFFLDRVLDTDSLAALKARFNRSMLAPMVNGRHMMAVPSGVATRLTTALRHRRRTQVPMGMGMSMGGGRLAKVELPIQQHQGDFGRHKDTYHTSDPAAERVVVEGQVGVLYVDGDGTMVFTHDGTGEEATIPIVPGRFIAWDNAAYTHRVEAGPSNTRARQVLGPVTWDDDKAAGSASAGAEWTRTAGLLGVCGVTPAPTPAPYAVSPTQSPVTSQPTQSPITSQPTQSPVTSQPTQQPVTGQPTVVPMQQPSGSPTAAPSANPTTTPTETPTGAPSARPTGAPSAKPTTMPTQQPTGAPSAIPSATPSAKPTGAPSASPTTAPTQQPTLFPTFAPEGPVQSVGKGFVCGPEVTLNSTGRRLQEEEEEEEAAEHRLLAVSWTPASCYAACKTRLGNPPSFVINIYEENGQQVCTCCRFCQGIRYVPSSQVFAFCSGAAGGLSLKAKAWPRLGAKRGGVVKYAVRVINVPALEGVGLRVVLPPFTDFAKARARPYIQSKTAGPVVNGSVVEWAAVPMPVKTRRIFTVIARVSAQAPVGTPLVFSSYVFQTTPGGITFCDTYASNVTVVVKK